MINTFPICLFYNCHTHPARSIIYNLNSYNNNGFAIRYKFNEAKQLLEIKAGFQILNHIDLVVILEQFLTDSEHLKSTSNLAKSYIINQSGATNLIYSELSKNFI